MWDSPWGRIIDDTVLGANSNWDIQHARDYLPATGAVKGENYMVLSLYQRLCPMATPKAIINGRGNILAF